MVCYLIFTDFYVALSGQAISVSLNKYLGFEALYIKTKASLLA